MNCKEHRTLDLYIDTAAKVKLLHDLLLDAQVGLSQIIPRKYVDRLRRAEYALIEIRDEAERRMVADHPEIENKDFEHVFYGGNGFYGELATRVTDRVNEILENKRKIR
jgi:hypothetical protein